MCTWYYKNGNKKCQCYYNENGIKDGEYKEYYENGTVYKSIEYSLGKIKGSNFFEFDDNNNKIIVFKEEFYDNSLKWDLSKKELISKKIKIGGFELLNQSKESDISISPFLVDSSEFSIETKINTNYFIGTGKAGLLFNFIDDKNYNYFFISRSRYFIGYVKAGEDVKQVDGYYSKSVKALDWNSLSINCNRDTLYYSINGRLHIEQAKSEIKGKGIAMYVSQKSNALFDDLTIKQFYKNRLEHNILDIEKVYDSNKKFTVQSISNGLLFSSKGYILSTYNNIKELNRIIVYVNVNDTIKQFDADVFLKDETHNLVVLKVKKSNEVVLAPPAFSFLKEVSLNLEAELVSYSFSEKSTSDNYKIDISYGKLKSFACYENFNNYFELSSNKKEIPSGTPIFTRKGEFLGVTYDTQKTKNDENIRAVKFQFFKALFPHMYEDIEVKKKIIQDQEKFEKGIEKNIVIIKTI